MCIFDIRLCAKPLSVKLALCNKKMLREPANCDPILLANKKCQIIHTRKTIAFISEKVFKRPSRPFCNMDEQIYNMNHKTFVHMNRVKNNCSSCPALIILCTMRAAHQSRTNQLWSCNAGSRSRTGAISRAAIILSPNANA